jgi:CRP-like cAMP-binding protein
MEARAIPLPYTTVPTSDACQWHAATTVILQQALSPRPPALTNRILKHIPDRDRASLLSEAEFIVLRPGQTLASPGEEVGTVYFPDSGVMAWISEMTTGHQVAVALVGAEGLVGISPLLSIPRHTQRVVALLESAGYRIPLAALRRTFEERVAFRSTVLGHIGRQLIEVASLVACARVHSHRQRLARSILTMTDKAGELSLPITHDVLAQVVGGPRHAVTVALNELRSKGAIAHLRGRVDILNRQALVAHACECYPHLRQLITSTSAG